MTIEFLMDRFRRAPEAEAIIWRDQSYSYGWLVRAVERWGAVLAEGKTGPGCVVSLEADFSPGSVALLLALIERGCICVPLTAAVEMKKEEFRAVAEVEAIARDTGADRIRLELLDRRATHPLIGQLRASGHPGLILFSSGSTGKAKAALHDFAPLLEKFKTPRRSRRILTFLLFDHIGGINTLLYTLSNAGCIVTVQDRAPDAVFEAIDRHRVQVLPTSPTFLNLALASEAWRRHGLTSLELVTYGTEVMPQETLERLHACLPNVELLQTYGLSEVGILRSKSKDSGSLWVKIGGEGYRTRIVDGLLEIKAESAMLGYLNAESPFTEDGWFKTGDMVEADGEYLRILGRRSDLINVGGEKVYPAEVEGVLQQIPGVEEVVVSGEPNPLVGQIVAARVKLGSAESLREFEARMHEFCRGRLPRFKIPQKVILTQTSLHSARYKRLGKEVDS
jgi:acyl-CoA synthetase (AMP-forming)/AMP-acid ligase II